ncbi:hypothetical protein NIES4074_21530 [Cylindrospermum sp. NIES-4074]|nr:hypothetical protein NIES4074_21530 [Cylindrospermum sp. NIES-4074]
MTAQLQTSILPSEKPRKDIKLIESTYKSNTLSDYTEKIEHLYKNFKYSNNSNHYWNEPELSMLYGTPLYESASASQKLALNHVHWFGMYNVVAASETETIAYNQITSGVFSACGYETLARELALETHQERSHINAFHKIGYMTMKDLLGKEAFKAPLKGKLHQLTSQDVVQSPTSLRLLKSLFLKCENSSLASSQYNFLRFAAKKMLKQNQQYYSQYLKELDENNKFIPVSTTGLIGRGISPKSLQRFFAFNWGSSPFLASQYYSVRIMANMVLKNTEHGISKYFKSLAKKGEVIPDPTAVSHYHFLDESFHSTTSLVLARDLYKNFSPPTAYEKYIANLAIYMMQCGILSGISATAPDRYYADDYSLMYFVYRLLQSPVFEMSTQDALYWMEKCFCQEHEGFQMAAKYHQRLRLDMCRFYENLDYLWPVNREMRVMATGGSVDKAVQNNIKLFQDFSKLVTSENL